MNGVQVVNEWDRVPARLRVLQTAWDQFVAARDALEGHIDILRSLIKPDREFVFLPSDAEQLPDLGKMRSALFDDMFQLALSYFLKDGVKIDTSKVSSKIAKNLGWDDRNDEVIFDVLIIWEALEQALAGSKANDAAAQQAADKLVDALRRNPGWFQSQSYRLAKVNFGASFRERYENEWKYHKASGTYEMIWYASIDDFDKKWQNTNRYSYHTFTELSTNLSAMNTLLRLSKDNHEQALGDIEFIKSVISVMHSQREEVRSRVQMTLHKAVTGITYNNKFAVRVTAEVKDTLTNLLFEHSSKIHKAEAA